MCFYISCHFSLLLLFLLSLLQVSAIRVVTWNIEFGYCLSALIHELQHLQPDILLIQECDMLISRDFTHPHLRFSCLNALCRALNMCGCFVGHHAYGSDSQKVKGLWGCAILSRFDLELPSIHYVRLEHLPDYPRSALSTIVQTPLVCPYLRCLLLYQNHVIALLLLF
jgi:hypothetical protein